MRGGPVWSERKTEKVRKEKRCERGKKWENPPTRTSLLFLKTTLRALRMEWRISGNLGFTCFLTHRDTHRDGRTQKTKHIHLLPQLPPVCLFKHISNCIRLSIYTAFTIAGKIVPFHVFCVYLEQHVIPSSPKIRFFIFVCFPFPTQGGTENKHNASTYQISLELSKNVA